MRLKDGMQRAQRQCPMRAAVTNQKYLRRGQTYWCLNPEFPANQSKPINSLSLCSLSIWVFWRGGKRRLYSKYLDTSSFIHHQYLFPLSLLVFGLHTFNFLVYPPTHTPRLFLYGCFSIWNMHKEKDLSFLIITFGYIFLHTLVLNVIFRVSHNIEISFFKQIANYTTSSFPRQSEKFIVLYTLKTLFLCFSGLWHQSFIRALDCKPEDLSFSPWGPPKR